MKRIVQLIFSTGMLLLFIYIVFRMISTIITLPKEDVFVLPFVTITEETEYVDEVVKESEIGDMPTGCFANCHGAQVRFYCTNQENTDKYCYSLCLGAMDYACIH